MPTANFHCTRAATSFRGYAVAANCMVIPNIWSVHHDPEYWSPDPEAYRPERHLDAARFRASGHVMPFSVGRRFCAGKRIAEREIFVFLVELLRHFRVQLYEGDHVGVEGASVALYVTDPYKLVISSRS